MLDNQEEVVIRDLGDEEKTPHKLSEDFINRHKAESGQTASS